ncbi:MAG: tRNA epoxyqueuosine(34) reductase QueG, partial [Ignavibacteriaceae bacterium]
IKFSEITGVSEFYPKDGNKEIKLSEIREMNNKEFKSRFARSPILRTKLKGLKRNAEFLE